MAHGDNLRDLIELAKREMPGVPPEAWEKFLALAGNHYGGSKVYVNAPNRKRAKLELLAQLDADLDAADLAKKLGISLRHAQRLKRLR